MGSSRISSRDRCARWHSRQRDLGLVAERELDKGCVEGQFQSGRQLSAPARPDHRVGTEAAVEFEGFAENAEMPMVALSSGTNAT